MSHTLNKLYRKAQVTVVSRPTHVGQDHHHEGHLESLVGISAEALLHHDPHPGSEMVLIPAVQAIGEMFNANKLLGAYYWREVWHRQVPKGDNDHHHYLALPASCCEVTEPIPV